MDEFFEGTRNCYLTAICQIVALFIPVLDLRDLQL